VTCWLLEGWIPAGSIIGVIDLDDTEPDELLALRPCSDHEDEERGANEKRRRNDDPDQGRLSVRSRRSMGQQFPGVAGMKRTDLELRPEHGNEAGDASPKTTPRGGRIALPVRIMDAPDAVLLRDAWKVAGYPVLARSHCSTLGH
jgi:hypothetical protein